MPEFPKTIIMLASENDSLVNGKVGGLADVIRDLPNALANFGYQVIVITPAYGFLHKDNPVKFLSAVNFPFGGKIITGDIWEVSAKQPKQNVIHLVFEHPEIRGNKIYSVDPPDKPYAQDATKYAMFCSAVGQFIKSFPPSTIIHLHDWHMGFFNLLKEIHPGFKHLKQHKVVFTIHNLGYQGNRPIQGKCASVEQWFPELFQDSAWIDEWKDPRYTEPQFTPLAAGIRYSDKVNTVSPSYAKEILQPSNHEIAFYGGEGLEQFLLEKNEENSLFGILNGIEYPPHNNNQPISFSELCNLCINEIVSDSQSDAFSNKVIERLEKIKTVQPSIILTSVTRVTEQKVRLLLESGSDKITALDAILKHLEKVNGFYFLLGNGPKEMEEKFEKAFIKHERLILTKLYSNKIGPALYSTGTIFMMPSIFEPCGISQMIAMQNGQPCIVHATGGLKDTVIDGVNGFQFSGNTIQVKVDNFVSVTKKVIDLYLSEKSQWEKIKSAAAAARFDWNESAKKYIEHLYN
ncbi:MAG: glycogen/starch synthase [Ignavibacteriales bacterium]|nr:glycogen/starch synthase [Ignavibacteriales bacterium]